MINREKYVKSKKNYDLKQRSPQGSNVPQRSLVRRMMQAAPKGATWLTLLLSILLPMAIGMGIMASQLTRTSRSHDRPQPGLPHISLEPDVTHVSLAEQARYNHLNHLDPLLCPQGFDHILAHNVHDHQY